jgi:hypothetical protein
VTPNLKKISHWFIGINIIIGVIYAILKYCFITDGEFGPESHPIQPYFQYAHILLVPLMVFVFGLLFGDHILVKVRNSSLKKWLSGYSLILTILLVTLSGYLLQLPLMSSRQFMIIFHCVVAAIWTIAYIFHARGS